MVTRGPDRGKEFLFDRPSARVGTDVGNDLVLSDPSVSTQHFEIQLCEHGPLLRDAGSTNGTFVDGHRVGEIYLLGRSEIRAGETSLRFDLDRGELELPLSRRTNFGELLGHSPAMRAAFAMLERVAASDATLLIEGETGTGKELAARAVHDQSARAAAPFCVFDCGGVAATLIESQLFGHLKGAYSGASETRAGAFARADGGSLVLDEIGELPLELQPKLLRCVETGSVQPVGADAPRACDVRLIACTNRNLAEEVRAGRFREDLFFRLSVVTVHLPSLRQRREEIPRLVAHFLRRLEAPADLEVPAPLMSLLLGHSWPGNVRELRNVVQRLVALPAEDPAYYLSEGAAGVPPATPPVPTELPFREAKQQWIEAFERQYLSILLAASGGNVSEVARLSGLSRQSCHRIIQKHGLDVS